MFALFNPNRHFDASTMRSSPITYTNPFTDSDLSDQLINEWFGRFAAPAGQASPAKVFNPKFDLRETEEAYELHGELPGLKRENASIEFSDWKTIVVKGRVEREYTASNSPAPASPATTSTHEVAVEDTAAPKKASVSDAEDEDWNDVNEKAASPKASKAAVATVDSAERRSVARQAPQAPANRYMVSERSVGEFSRTFKFPSPIDRDGTTATLENGILSVTIPKAAKKEARRIAIN